MSRSASAWRSALSRLSITHGAADERERLPAADRCVIRPRLRARAAGHYRFSRLEHRAQQRRLVRRGRCAGGRRG